MPLRRPNTQSRQGLTLLELLVVVAVITLLAAILLPALASIRELGRRAKCGKSAAQLATAQNAYAADCNVKGRPEAYVRGVEPLTGAGAFSGSDRLVRTNASRAYVWLVRAGFVDSLNALACSSDPFVAVLDGSAGSLRTSDEDLHGAGPLVEGSPVPAGTGFAAPGSPAMTESGRTFFSYSMQAGNPDTRFGPRPGMHPKVPLFGERNPWCSGVAAASGGAPVTQAGDNPEGNPFNHNRDGLTVAYTDGRSAFLPSARMLEIPLARGAGAAMGYAYAYDTRPPTPDVKTITAADGRCPPVDTWSGNRSPNLTVWLVD